MGSECEPRDSAGCIINEPSDDESILQVSEESLLTQPSCPELGPKWSKVPNPPTPKRDAQAPPSAAPDPKARRVDPSSFSKSDLGFSHRHAMSPPAAYLITVVAEQIWLAGNGPTCGWPTSSVLFPDSNPTDAIQFLTPEISGTRRPTSAGWRAPQWILSRPLSRQPGLRLLTPVNFAPMTRTLV